MANVSEISRRSMYHVDSGIACGPVSSTAIIVEIVLDIDGQRFFLHGEWVDIAGDYYYEVNTESLFDVYQKMLNTENDEDEQKAIEERDRISQGCIKEDSIFKPYYAELKKMIHDEMKSHGIEDYEEDD